MDLAVGSELWIEKDSTLSPPFSPMLIDPYEQETIDAMFQQLQPLPQYLPPKTRVLLVTAEPVKIKTPQLGIIGLRSTWARLGLAMSPVFVDSGFEGKLTFSIMNQSSHKLMMRPGDAVWQMEFTVDSQRARYSGKYQGSDKLALPKAFKKESQ